MNKDEALHQQMTLTAQKPVNSRDLGFLQEWMRRPTMGNVYLIGRDSDIWSEPDLSDLIALRAGHSDDLFTQWLSDTFVHTYHRVIGRFFRVLLFVPFWIVSS